MSFRRPLDGVIDLPTIQRYLNFTTADLDLYGSDVSSNAASYYTSGIKGRFAKPNSPMTTFE